jgi:hypothetical protein
MGQFFLRILAFVLGFKHENPKELESRGREMKQDMLLKKLNNRIDLAELESIWLIGGIEYSEPKANKIKELHEQGLRYDFKIPTNFDFEGDYIDFYQVATKSKRFYLIAMSDTFALSKDDDVMMFFEVRAPYSTSNLSPKLLYYPNKK